MHVLVHGNASPFIKLFRTLTMQIDAISTVDTLLPFEVYPPESECICPAIGAYEIALNDRGPQWVREALRAFRPRMGNTAGTLDLQKARSRAFVRAALRSAQAVLGKYEEAFSEDASLREALAVATQAIMSPPGVAGVYASINAAANAARAARSVVSPRRAVFAAADSARAAAHAVFALQAGQLTIAASDSVYAAYAAGIAGNMDQWRFHINAVTEALSLTEIPEC
jgi:hypothetical protein